MLTVWGLRLRLSLKCLDSGSVLLEKDETVAETAEVSYLPKYFLKSFSCLPTTLGEGLEIPTGPWKKEDTGAVRGQGQE